MFLHDINVWLALAFEAHFHHRAAKARFNALPDDASAFCRMTQQGFLRLATNPRAMQDDAVSMVDAWRLYDMFAGDPRVSFAHEPAELEPIWRAHTQRESFSTKVWNDAFLAAFAQAGSLTLVTFDRGLAQQWDVASTLLV